MLDIRYIACSLIAAVAIVAMAIRLFGPADTSTTATATLKPRIEPSRVVEQPAPIAEPKKTAAPAKTPAAPAPEITGSIAEPAKEAPKRAARPRKKEEAEFQFQWPIFRGFGQQN